MAPPERMVRSIARHNRPIIPLNTGTVPALRWSLLRVLQLLSIGYAIRKLYGIHTIFSYTAMVLALSLLVGYLVPASLRVDTDGPPEWIWGALGVVPCAAFFLFRYASL